MLTRLWWQIYWINKTVGTGYDNRSLQILGDLCMITNPFGLASYGVSGLLCENNRDIALPIRTNWLYLLNNLKTKRMTKVLEVGFGIWAIGLAVMGAVGVVYATVQVILGNTTGIVI